MNNVRVIIPARLDSTRLPRKMVADVNGLPLIVQTYRSTVAANMGEVIVACDSEEIAKLIEDNGGNAVLTDPALPSGTDRVYAAVKALGISDGIIVNLQGDHPYIDPIFVSESVKLCMNDGVDIATPIVKINDESYRLESSVKPVVTFYSDKYANAHYFSRSVVPFSGPYYHHVGVYAYKFEALERFVSLKQSPLEKSERLEQLRALEAGINIHTVLCNAEIPISVDTEVDLQKAIEFGKHILR